MTPSLAVTTSTCVFVNISRRIPRSSKASTSDATTGAAAAEGSRRKGQDRALLHNPVPKSTCRSSPQTGRSKAYHPEADPGQVRAAGGGPRSKDGQPCRLALKDAGLIRSQIDEVVLVGGMTRMPKVQQLVKESSARSRTTASIPTKSSPSARRSRAACCTAT